MTIYCPNCGAPNTDEAEKCVKCGTELRKVARPARFKGTMMMNAPAIPPGTAPPGTSPPAASGPAAPSGVGSPAVPPATTPAAPTTSGGPAQAGGFRRELGFQATMLGPMVAPPVPGGAPGVTPSAGPATPPTESPGPAAPQAPSFGSATAASPPGAIDATISPNNPAFTTAPTQMMPETPAPMSASSAATPPFGAAGGFGGTPGMQEPAPAVAASAATPGFSNLPVTGGNFGGGFPAPPPPPATIADPNKKKTWLWIGLGCLGLSLVACSIGGWFAWRYAAENVESTVTAFGAEASRMPLIFTLSGIQSSCAVDATGEGARAHFHPETFDRVKSQVCGLDAKVVEAMGNDQASKVETLAKTNDAAKATRLGLDPDVCFRYTTKGSAVVGCILDEGFKIIDLELAR